MIRDTDSNALIETNINELNKYRVEKQRVREFAALKRDVEELKQSVSNICRILKKMEN